MINSNGFTKNVTKTKMQFFFISGGELKSKEVTLFGYYDLYHARPIVRKMGNPQILEPKLTYETVKMFFNYEDGKEV